MNINPLLKLQRQAKRARRASRRVRFHPTDKVDPNWLPFSAGPETCGIPPFPERRSYHSSRRDARRRRNAQERGGAR